jgi:pimeloyl-ACP methyl ester carboxylesterase
MKNRPAIVMIHGLLGSLEYFSPASFLPDIDVYTPRLLGYGGFDHQDSIENLSLQNQVDFVKQMVIEEIQRPCWLLGHSVGGAIAMMFAAQNPELVVGMINVEGNFTLNDAFWCQKISQLPVEVWRQDYEQIRNRPETWLLDSGITPTQKRTAWAKEILDFQPAATAQAVAKAVIRETASPEYQQTIQTIGAQQKPLYLLAGERSKDQWDIPPQILNAAKQLIVQSKVGHLMMLEEPREFCDLLSFLWEPDETEGSCPLGQNV